ncbi:TPA: hypothetical protein ROX88_001283 [Bacillus pseudomycoides]|nr:hypothetical protein [Bacillus pseudomycoides]
MNEQPKNDQNVANPQNAQNAMKSSDSQQIKREILKIKQGGCGCGKRRQL